MKRLNFYPILATLMLLTLPISGTADPKIPLVSVEMKLQKISKHVYLAQGKAGTATENKGFISNASAIITDEGVVVFDSLGTPSLGALFLSKIREITDKPIVKVITSHYHADHIYGLQVFKAVGAKIIAPEGYQEYLYELVGKQRLVKRKKSLAPWVNDNTRLIPPDEVISKTTTFELGGVHFTINYLGKAHSDGDLTLLVEEDKVLLSGDLIFEGRVPFIGDADTDHWLELINKLDNSKLKALIPGHGGVVKDPNAAIQLTRHYLSVVRDKMQEAVDEMMTFEEAYDTADWSEFENLPAFRAAHKQNAFSIFLTLERESME